jgi:hypothetical protein
VGRAVGRPDNQGGGHDLDSKAPGSPGTFREGRFDTTRRTAEGLPLQVVLPLEFRAQTSFEGRPIFRTKHKYIGYKILMQTLV